MRKQVKTVVASPKEGFNNYSIELSSGKTASLRLSSCVYGLPRLYFLVHVIQNETAYALKSPALHSSIIFQRCFFQTSLKSMEHSIGMSHRKTFWPLTLISFHLTYMMNLGSILLFRRVSGNRQRDTHTDRWLHHPLTRDAKEGLQLVGLFPINTSFSMTTCWQ